MAEISTFLKSLGKAESDLFDLTHVRGRNPDAPHDGGHFAVRGTTRPLSVSPIESRLLYNLVTLAQAKSVIELGTGFGYSAAWIAAALSQNVPGGKLLTIDDWSEGEGLSKNKETAISLWQRLGLMDVICPLTGHSPSIFGNIDYSTFDIAFIDGEHRNGQPLIDYLEISMRMNPRGMIIFHDVQEKYDVIEAVEAARRDGYILFPINSSCNPVVAYKADGIDQLISCAIYLAEKGCLAYRQNHD